MEQANGHLTQQQFDYLKPPKEAYLYFPAESDIISGKEKKIARWYFDGDTPYTPYEKESLEKLYTRLKEKNKMDIIEGWTVQQIMRELQGNQFDVKKAQLDIESQNEWKKNVLSEPDNDINTFLSSGFMKVIGRDHRYRPIMLMNVYLLDPKVLSKDAILKGCDYVSKIILDKMMIPGQIENWVIIMDLNKQGLGSIPLSLIKTIISYLSKHYKSRLYRIYMVNTTSAITSTWTAIKLFLDKFTIKKINILKESVPEMLYSHANKSQIMQKFGGSIPDTEAIWPPKLNDKGPFLLEGEEYRDNFLSVEEYKTKSASIKEGVVCKELLQ